MPKNTNKFLATRMGEIFSRMVPSGTEIASHAINAALQGRRTDSAWIRSNFSELIERVQLDAYQRYLEAEKEGWKEAVSQVLADVFRHCHSPGEIIGEIGVRFEVFDQFFLSRTQGRRARAGRAFELLVRELFEILGYPVSGNSTLQGRPTFVFEKPNGTRILLTLKRSLRERWQQLAAQQQKQAERFLATIDEELTLEDFVQMKAQSITLVVPARLKNQIPDYHRSSNVITFERFIKTKLDPLL